MLFKPFFVNWFFLLTDQFALRVTTCHRDVCVYYRSVLYQKMPMRACLTPGPRGHVQLTKWETGSFIKRRRKRHKVNHCWCTRRHDHLANVGQDESLRCHVGLRNFQIYFRWPLNGQIVRNSLFVMGWAKNSSKFCQKMILKIICTINFTLNQRNYTYAILITYSFSMVNTKYDQLT
jgi:hypothetical protein